MTHTVTGAPGWDHVRTSRAPTASGDQVGGASASLWSEGSLRGRDVALASVTVTLLVVALDLVLSGSLSFFFDVCIVPISLVAALAVRPRDFFWVAVLPPLLVLSTTIELALFAPQAIGAPGDGPLQAALIGLADHGSATLWAQALTLAVLAVRRRVLALPALVPPAGKLPPPMDVQGGLVAAYDDAVDTFGVETVARVEAEIATAADDSASRV